MTKKIMLATSVALALGFALGATLLPERGRAQSSNDDVAVAPAPGGGAWVVSGDSIRLCTTPSVTRGTGPGRPVCGEAAPLR